MTYEYESKFGGQSALRIETVMRQTMSSGTSFNRMQSTLKNQGLGYNRQVMQNDWRKFQAIDRSKTPEARTRAESWYTKVFLPFKEESGLSFKEATQTLKSLQEKTVETLEEAQIARNYAELYEKAFD
jgi:hypothetical protein